MVDKGEILPVKILYEGGMGEIVEKKSRFIATIAPVETEEEAALFIESVKKRYWDASHNCTAFVIGDKNQLTRCSDDGEPSGTAGRPMLEVLLGLGITNIAVVVTRYFGGVLLGTGGLVRAYTKAVQEGIANCKVATRIYGTQVEIITDYTGLGKIQYLLQKEGIKEYDTEYTQEVRIHVFLSQSVKEKILKEVVEVTAGRAKMEEIEECFRLLYQ